MLNTRPNPTLKLIASLALLLITTATRADISGGLTKAEQGLNWVQQTMLAFSATVISIAIIWTGWQMLYEAKRFSELARIFFAALLIGSATALGALFVG